MDFKEDIVIGLEIHAELNTKTKLFCGCSTENTEPNTHTCEVCLGHPGSKPVLNKKALIYSLKLCLALKCKVAPELIFSRKSYFYPDMAKNYQITQYEVPLGSNGELALKEGKVIGITRAHMEEDPAALVHKGGMQTAKTVLVDYNRSGRPLIEIVTEPDMNSPEEARDFMKELIRVLTYLKIFDQNKCIIKADANISIKESGYVRSEVKNVTGFKEIERALKYEIDRQKKAVKDGKKLKQETRAWDSDAGVTRLLRTKETEMDYGYILDPDLVVTDITQDMINDAKGEIPELAQDRKVKYIEQYKIDKVDADVLAKNVDIADLFEKVIADKAIDPVLAARWHRRELLSALNYSKTTLDKTKITEKHMADVLKAVQDKKITDAIGKKLIQDLVQEPFDVDKRIKSEGLDEGPKSDELENICKEAIKNSKKAVDDYKSGNEKALFFITGQVMKATKGQAKPDEVNKILKKLIR